MLYWQKEGFLYILNVSFQSWHSVIDGVSNSVYQMEVHYKLIENRWIWNSYITLHNSRTINKVCLNCHNINEVEKLSIVKSKLLQSPDDLIFFVKTNMVYKESILFVW